MGDKRLICEGCGTGYLGRTAPQLLCRQCRESERDRTCSKCGDVFRAAGRGSVCRQCQAAYAAQWEQDNKTRKRDVRHGLETGQFDRMLMEQNGLCASCGERPATHVDHDRSCCNFTPSQGQKACGKCVRGLVCYHCNVGIGHLGDTVDGVTKALAYLIRYEKIKSEVPF